MICAQCSSVFEPRNTVQKYCGEPCRILAHKARGKTRRAEARKANNTGNTLAARYAYLLDCERLKTRPEPCPKSIQLTKAVNHDRTR